MDICLNDNNTIVIFFNKNSVEIYERHSNRPKYDES